MEKLNMKLKMPLILKPNSRLQIVLNIIFPYWKSDDSFLLMNGFLDLQGRITYNILLYVFLFFTQLDQGVLSFPQTVCSSEVTDNAILSSLSSNFRAFLSIRLSITTHNKQHDRSHMQLQLSDCKAQCINITRVVASGLRHNILSSSNVCVDVF